MKKSLLLFAFLLAPCLSQAQSIDIPLIDNGIDLSSAVKAMRGAYIFDQHQDHLAGAFMRLAEYNPTWMNSENLVNLNAGVIWEVGGDHDGIGGPMASFTIRGDTLACKLLSSAWAKSNLKTMKVPVVEFGPFGGYIRRLGWLYGITASMGIGSIGK